MISIIDSGKLVNTDVSPMVPRSCEMVGLSTDTKPTGVSVGNGWSYIEMDTGKVFFYNAEDEEWLEFAGSGGGGGQGGNNVLVVNMVISGNTATLDKTWQEIYDAPFAVISAVFGENNKVFYNIVAVAYEDGPDSYVVTAVQAGYTHESELVFESSTASGYPSATDG